MKKYTRNSVSKFRAKTLRRKERNAKGLFVRENEIAREIVDAGYCIHTRLGAGLLESVYEAVMAYELQKRGLRFERQTKIS